MLNVFAFLLTFAVACISLLVSRARACYPSNGSEKNGNTPARYEY